MQLAEACEHLVAWCYTHKPVLGSGLRTSGNRNAIAAALDAGLNVNLSAVGMHQADALADLGLAPVVAVVPSTLSDDWRSLRTPAGRRVLRCPAEYQGNKCNLCLWCADWRRDYIVGLTAHGWKNKVNAIVERMERRYEQ
jgi:hypothetical protein